MTLQVPFEGFAHAAEHIAGAKTVFVSQHPNGSMATCANKEATAHVIAVSKLSPEEAKDALKAEKLDVFDGFWTDDASLELEGDPLSKAFVAAVSYVSNDSVPGVWVDALPEQATQIQVLRNMYSEFRDTGELGDVTFEEFVRLSSPNVVVVSATQLRGYLLAKEQA